MFFLADLFGRFGWNVRAFTEEDVLRICRRLKVKVIEYPLSGTLGSYMRVGGRAFITVDSRLRGVQRLYVLLHELAHHLLHVPEDVTVAYFFRLRPHTKQEYEAEVFAAVALLPEPVLRRIIYEGGDFEGEGFTQDIIEFRLKVLDRYGV
jgi:Zn-dependent peptidase ImmA (M78 family)